jgi:hypothetical protein
MQHGVGPKNLLLQAAFQRFYFCGLVFSYSVKQAAKRQAKQYAALFCPHPLTINSGLLDSGQSSFTFSAKSKTAACPASLNLVEKPD